MSIQVLREEKEGVREKDEQTAIKKDKQRERERACLQAVMMCICPLSRIAVQTGALQHFSLCIHTKPNKKNCFNELCFFLQCINIHFKLSLCLKGTVRPPKMKNPLII